jgi:hypothetical protein
MNTNLETLTVAYCVGAGVALLVVLVALLLQRR